MDRKDLPKSWPVVLLGIFLVYYIVSTIRSYLRLRHFKGPLFASLSNIWYIRVAVSKRAHLHFAEVSNKYGPLARIGPNTLITNDMDLYRKINAVRTPYRRGEWYRAFKFDADRQNIFSELDEEKHMSMRNRVAAGYSGKDSPEFESDMDKVLWALFDLLKNKFNSTPGTLKPMDFAKVIQFFTLDVITSLGHGHPFGYITDGEVIDKYEYCKTMDDNFPVMNFFSAVPLLAHIMSIPSVQRQAIPTVKDRVGMGKVKAVNAELIARRFGDKKEYRQDITQSFIAHGLSQGEANDELLLQILAGSDTTATILRSGFISIIGNPQVYRSLQQACIEAKVPISEIISYTRAQQIPYLVATVREALRHHPAATGLLPRVTPPEGDYYNGLFIPPGTQIGLSAWTMHRTNTAVYGEDAAMFRPDRWLEASAEKQREMEKAQDLVFGFGRYRCMGEKIAKVELHKTFFELMRRFDWAFVDPTNVLEKNHNYGMFQQAGMWVKVTEKAR